MNERIKELHNKVFAESMNMRWNIEDAEKFAELIVRECISKAEDYGLGNDAVEQMKKDFGVEE